MHYRQRPANEMSRSPRAARWVRPRAAF
jgi:hypothetical protein